MISHMEIEPALRIFFGDITGSHLTTNSVFSLVRVFSLFTSDNLHKTLVDVSLTISATHWFNHGRAVAFLWTHTCGCSIRGVMTHRVLWTFYNAASTS